MPRQSANYPNEVNRTFNGVSYVGVYMHSPGYFADENKPTAKEIAKRIRAIGIPARVITLPATGGMLGTVQRDTVMVPDDFEMDSRVLDIIPDDYGR